MLCFSFHQTLAPSPFLGEPSKTEACDDTRQSPDVSFILNNFTRWDLFVYRYTRCRVCMFTPTEVGQTPPDYKRRVSPHVVCSLSWPCSPYRGPARRSRQESTSRSKRRRRSTAQTSVGKKRHTTTTTTTTTVLHVEFVSMRFKLHNDPTDRPS